MLKITDGVNVKTVTKGMFDNLYYKMGYKIIAEMVPVKEPVVEEEKPVEVKEKKGNAIRKR